MKELFIIICASYFLSCSNQEQNNAASDKKPDQDTNNTVTVRQNPDESKWTDNFLELRKAITIGDREAVKDFIDFPIKSEGNEIWYLANSRLVMEIHPKDIKPFTEVDFDQYFSSIFAMDLRKTLEKLNVEEFFRTNKSTSPEIQVVEDSRSRLEASYDKGTRIMTLKLITILETISESITSQEYVTIYEFDITPDQKIKFKQVRVMG